MRDLLNILLRIALLVTCAPILSAWAWTATTSSSSSSRTRSLQIPSSRSMMMMRTGTLRSSTSNRNARGLSLLKLSESSNDSDSTASTSSEVVSSSTSSSSSSSSAAASTESPVVDSTISNAWISTFDESGRGLVEEENKQRIDQMGDFDSNPAYASDRMEQMRAAIQARTASLGLEKSVISQQLIQEASARAAAGQRSNNFGLDLSQITNSDTPGNNIMREELPEGLPAMFYDPEEQMTDEEKLESDPDGQLPIWEQAAKELQNAQWPSFWSSIREVAVVIFVVVLTGVIIIGWDKYIRELYTSWGVIPSQEDIMSGIGGRSLEGLELPEGWINGMNDQDVATLENDMPQLGSLLPPPSTITPPPTEATGLPGL